MWHGTGTGMEADMKYYGFVSACYELPEDFLIPDMMNYVNRDKKFIRVFENTERRTIRIISNNKVIMQFTADSDKGNEESHYLLMKQFEDYLNSSGQGTVMFIGLEDLSQEPSTASILYETFIRSGNSLEFVRTPWMDSKRFNLLRQTEETTTLGLIRDQIQSYFQLKQYEKGSPEIDLRNINTYQLPESVKKNWLKR
jgi:hypothetical protein